MENEEYLSKLQELEKELAAVNARLREQQDIEEIKQLTYKYENCVCLSEFDHVMDLFAKDVVSDFGASDEDSHQEYTREGLGKFYKEKLSKIHCGKEGLFLAHPLITVDGDTAKGSWLLYILYFYPRTGQILWFTQLRMWLDYVREDGSWKISYIKARERLGIPGGGAPLEIFGLSELP